MKTCTTEMVMFSMGGITNRNDICCKIGMSDQKYEQPVQDALFGRQSYFGLVYLFLDYNWD